MSIWHWLIVLLVVVLLFGSGRLPQLMGDVAKGMKTLKKGLQDDDEPALEAPPARQAAEPAPGRDGSTPV